MINIVFNPCARDPHEIEMGQYLFFHPVDGIETISVTANPNGFTSMNAVCTSLGMTEDVVRRVSTEVNGRYEVAILENYAKRLLVVPRTIEKIRRNRRTCLVTDLLQACKACNVKSLQFTHYGFIQNRLLHRDVDRLFEVLLNPLIDAQFDMDFVIDADTRVIDEMKHIHNYFAKSFYKLDESKLKHFHSYA